jgi:chemosensory pili system protein ChpA (sensor histidine kinase/response regulator)
METGFTIDDVRETLTQDVTRLLGRIERAARDILDDRALAPDGEPASLARFLAIGDHSHAIHGTSCLVSAQSLADSSARMEALAHHGLDQLTRALRHLACARDIAATIASGSTDMLAMLSHELDGRPAAACAIADSWGLRVEGVLDGSSAASSAESAASLRVVPAEVATPPAPAHSAPPAATGESHGPTAIDDGWGGFDDAPAAQAVAAPPAPAATRPPDEYSFASSIAEPARDAEAMNQAMNGAIGEAMGDAVVDPDLAEVFATEASSTLAVLDDALDALTARLDDRALLKSIERGFHTLKGAAATVGLTAVSARATDLQDRAEVLVDAGRPVTAREAAELIRDTAALRRLAGIPAPSPAVAPGPAAFDEMAAELDREARQVLDEAEHLRASLRAADPAAAPPIARELGLAMHRLYSSALTADVPELAEAAATAQLLAEAAPVDTARLAAELARCRTLVAHRMLHARSLATGPAAVPHPSDDLAAIAPPRGGSGAAHRVAVPVPDAEVDASFQQECAELLELLDRTALAMERSDRPREPIGELLRGYHTLKGVVNALGLQPIGDQLHRAEDLLERLAASTILPPLRTITSVLLWFHGELRRQLATVRLGYVELEPGRLDARLTRLLDRASQSASATGTRPSQLGSWESRLGEGSEASAPVDSPAPDRRNLRVSLDRLDALMNLAGELVIGRSRLLGRIDWLRGLQVDLGRSSRRVIDVVEKFRDEHEFSRFARGGKDRAVRWSGFSELELDRYEDVNILARSLSEGSNDLHDLFGQLAGGLGALADDSDALGTIIAGIQGEVTRTRMVPLDTLFSRLELPVRDAAQREDREVRVETIGADVHLDKAIADALFQPMLHLVRNAVSHGIEAPQVRLAAGKPAHGTITLRARQELGQIVVEIADDGAGLDLERLRERGAALGLIAHDTPLDDPRIRDLVFVHGLSTHVGADAVAGRGIGCDVVRRAVDRLNGSLRVETVRHEHTVFSITLPVTLAITRALLVRNAGETFAVPLYFTERIIDAHEVEVIESANQRRIELDGAFVPIRPLGEFVSGPTSPAGPILLLAVGAQRLVVQVDEVVTQEEVVVKSLGALLRGHPMFAGVTIRGTGQTVLILDVPSMTGTALGRHPAAQPAHPVPLAAPALVVPAAPAAPAAPAPVDRDRPLHVLFVDDSVSVRKVAERALKQLGVEVTLATDGADALDKLRTGRFDLVFTDLEMPRMHGYELIRELRFLPAFQTLPIVVVTSRSGKKHRDEAHALGASEYLTKPFTSRSLAAALVKFGGTRAAGLTSVAHNEAHHEASGSEATS